MYKSPHNRRYFIDSMKRQVRSLTCFSSTHTNAHELRRTEHRDFTALRTHNKNVCAFNDEMKNSYGQIQPTKKQQRTRV